MKAGMARLVTEFLEELALREVTLVGNDREGALLLVSEGIDGRSLRPDADVDRVGQDGGAGFPCTLP